MPRSRPLALLITALAVLAGLVAVGAQANAATGLPSHVLTGYWHNFVNAAGPMRLAATPSEYDLVAVAFGEATTTPGEVRFAVDPDLSSALGGYRDDDLRADIATLQQQGRKVILSVGGELGQIRVADPAAATQFADSVYALMQQYGFDGVDIDLENGLHPEYMAQALRSLHAKAGDDLIITLAPQTIDMQSRQGSYFDLALRISDILTIVNMQYYNSGSMLGCDGQVYHQGSVDFITALACIQLENGLRPDQVGLGLPAGAGAAGGGVVDPSVVTAALDCLAYGTRCGSFQPPRTYPGIRGAMTWSVNWDDHNGGRFADTVGPHLDTLPGEGDQPPPSDDPTEPPPSDDPTEPPPADTWSAGTAYTVGDTVTYDGITYTCRQSHTALSGWEPPNTPALWLAQ